MLIIKSTNQSIRRSLSISLALLLWLPAHSLLADIYQWQDHLGNWHFSNQPDAASQHVRTAETQPPIEERAQVVHTSHSTWVDLESKLREALQPKSAIEEAMLAVVAIGTSTGIGTGFFINDEGYIATLASTIRPKGTATEANATIQQLQQRSEEAKARYEAEQSQLAFIKEQVDLLTKRRTQLSGEERRIITAEWEAQKNHYSEQRSVMRQAKRAFKSAYHQFQAAETEYKIGINRSALDSTFTIYLADGTHHRAELVKIDQAQGVALIKITGFITPRLFLEEQVTPTYGMSLLQLNARLPKRQDLWIDTISMQHNPNIKPQVVINMDQPIMRLEKPIAKVEQGAPLVTEGGTLVGFTLGARRGADADHLDGHYAMEAKVLLKQFGDLMW